MRTRVFKDSTSYGSADEYWSRYNGLSNEVTRTWVASYWHEKMRDVVTPNFHDRVRRGEVIMNPKTKISERIVEDCYIIDAESGNTWDDACHFVFHKTLDYNVLPVSPAVLPSDELDELEEIILDIYDENIGKAVNQAWSNVDVSEAAALASLGELPETVRWFASLMTRMIRLIRFFKSKRKRLIAKAALKPAALADSLSDLWLEFRYAVRPLIFEAKQCCEAMQATIEKGSRQTARGWDKILDSTRTVETHVFREAWDVPIQWKRDALVNFRAGVLYDIESDINGLMALWGLDQSMEAIWELTPFSFIVDWFFTIGDVISAWSISPHLRPLGSWVTVESICTVSGEMYGSLGSHLDHWINEQSMELTQEGSYWEEARYTVRFPNPDRRIMPTLNINLDLAKLLDLATIGRSLFRGFRA